MLCGCGAGWSVATDSLDRVVLSVNGESSDVWVVGGGQGNGAESLVKRLAGGAWESVSGVSGTETLWWVSSGFVVGERGALYRVSGGALEKLPSLANATLFGVWGASADEAWAVGGSPLGNGENDVILRWDGAAWSRMPIAMPLDVAYFKVWGSARDDVWIVGEQGVALHFDGTAWTRVMTPTRSTLLTVAGRGKDEVWAVGGPPAVLLRWDGSAWQNETLPFEASGLTGVSVAPNGDLFVVGLAGTRWRRVSGKWSDDSDSPVLGDLHAVWAGSSEAWAVGGNYIATDPNTKRRGIVARYGAGGAPGLK
jgi:hypothetical protein